MFQVSGILGSICIILTKCFWTAIFCWGCTDEGPLQCDVSHIWQVLCNPWNEALGSALWVADNDMESGSDPRVFRCPQKKQLYISNTESWTRLLVQRLLRKARVFASLRRYLLLQSPFFSHNFSSVFPSKQILDFQIWTSSEMETKCRNIV